MSTTLIGLFDSADEANQVRQELVQSGIPAGQIQVHSSSGGTATTATTETGPHHEKNWWHSLKEAFTGEDEYETDDGTTIGADHYAEGIRRGGTTVRVEAPDNQVDAAVTIMQRHNVVDIDRRAAAWRESGWKGYDANARAFSNEEIAAERARYSTAKTGSSQQAAATGQQKMAVPVVEEKLNVGKRRVSGGGVRIIRRTTEKPVQANVNLREEQVSVERHRVDRPLTPEEASRAMKDQTVEVNATREQAVVSKEAKVVEEVVVNKTAQDRQETVRDTVKRADVDVERTPGQDAGSRTDKTSTTNTTTDRTAQEKNRKP
jgi:stress response protein YsnF